MRDVHAMRSTTPATAQAWLRPSRSRWDDAVAMIGEDGARVWRLYLVGGGLAFAQNRMGVDQILAVRPDDSGVAGFPPTRRGWDGD